MKYKYSDGEDKKEWLILLQKNYTCGTFIVRNLELI